MTRQASAPIALTVYGPRLDSTPVDRPDIRHADPACPRTARQCPSPPGVLRGGGVGGGASCLGQGRAACGRPMVAPACADLHNAAAARTWIEKAQAGGGGGPEGGAPPGGRSRSHSEACGPPIMAEALLRQFVARIFGDYVTERSLQRAIPSGGFATAIFQGEVAGESEQASGWCATIHWRGRRPDCRAIRGARLALPRALASRRAAKGAKQRYCAQLRGACHPRPSPWRRFTARRAQAPCNSAMTWSSSPTSWSAWASMCPSLWHAGCSARCT